MSKIDDYDCAPDIGLVVARIPYCVELMIAVC